MYRDNKKNLFIEREDVYEYLIEYRGSLLEQMKKVNYAAAYIITKKFAIVAVIGERIKELASEVPAIIFVNFRSIFVLEGSAVEDLSNISSVKLNPNLNLSGRGVIIGIADTGIDYMNKEFIREDGTSRIESIWDQTINDENTSEDDQGVFTGTIYSNEKINEAIKSAADGNDPYKIVPSKDEIGHGTQMASIAGARGYDKDIKGVAHDCNFVIVKVKEDLLYKSQLTSNNIKGVPVYNLTSLVAGIEFLKNYSLKMNKPMIILNSIGASDHSHDASDLFSRYVSEVGNTRKIVVVTGCGNEGAGEGHASGVLRTEGDIGEVQLNIAVKMAILPFKIWIRRPNKMSVSIVSPSGEESGFIRPKVEGMEKINFVYEGTDLTINFYTPDNITGLQIMRLQFNNIKEGIWTIRLRGEYIVGGRYDMWLPPLKTLQPGTKFLEANPDQTLSILGGAEKTISVTYYNQDNNSIVAESGRGFPLYGITKPDIAAPGVNIQASSIDGRKVLVTGASAAASIVAGTCALLVQWGIVDKNDIAMYSTKILNYLVSGASRKENTKYPDKGLGFGTLNFAGTFDRVAGIVAKTREINDFLELNVDKLFIRIPKSVGEVKWFEL